MSRVPEAANGSPRAGTTERVESLLFRSGLRFDQIDASTWVLQLDNRRRSRVVVKVDEPIVLLSVPIAAIDDEIRERERLFRTMLELNADLLHNAYAIEGDQLVLSGALQTDKLDANEFQAVLDDVTMALDTHLDKLSDWFQPLEIKPTPET